MVVEETKFRDANRWKEMEIIRPGKGEKDASAPRLRNGCESSGTKHNRARMFLTWYQVNARHPRAESLLKKIGKIAQLVGENRNILWNLFGKNVEMIRRRTIM